MFLPAQTSIFAEEIETPACEVLDLFRFKGALSYAKNDIFFSIF